jgi:multidrug resistance efflux pump
VLCAVLLAMTAAFGYRTYRLTPAGGETTASGTDASKPTATAGGSSAVASSGAVALVSKGYVIPAHKIQISPNKVGGILVFVDPNLEEGKRFKKGDVLARIDDFDFRADRDQAKGNLEEAKRRLTELTTAWPEEIKQLEARCDLAEARLRLSKIKSQNLERSGSGATREQLDEGRSMVIQDQKSCEDTKNALNLIQLTRKEQIAQAEARVAQTRAALNKAEQLLANCTIRAPISGTILAKNAEEGNNVNPAALSSGAGGIAVSLCDMADLSDLEVDLSIQERDISGLKVGQDCLIMPDAFQNYPPFLDLHPKGYEAKVTRMMPIADRSKGTISARVKLKVPKEEEGVFLKPDMSVLVSFLKTGK